MTLKPGPAKKLIVTVNESARWHGRSVYNALLELFQHKGLAGATVYRGILGYGAQKRIHRHKTLTLSSDDPIMIAMVDEEEKINKMITSLETMISGGCLIAVSDVTVVRYVEHAPAERG